MRPSKKSHKAESRPSKCPFFPPLKKMKLEITSFVRKRKRGKKKDNNNKKHSTNGVRGNSCDHPSIHGALVKARKDFLVSLNNSVFIIVVTKKERKFFQFLPNINITSTVPKLQADFSQSFNVEGDRFLLGKATNGNMTLLII